ncbi:MAG: zinc-dependent peptidase [Bacteroidota bacterium]
MPRTPSWKEAVNEPGALENVYTSALIVLVVAIVLVVIGIKILPKFKTKKLNSNQQVNALLISSLAIIAVGVLTNIPMLIVPPIFIIMIGSLTKIIPTPIQEEEEYSIETVKSNPSYLVYGGDELNFTREVYITVLLKHFPYYNLLNDLDKDKFIHRLQKFISRKTFIIHDKSGFREMPILISAAAIQLSFGFEKYLLPDFPNIQIYPEEFLGIHPSIRYLEGNVSNSCVNISWKHFLNGFKYPDDGQNVGLHEMAHAYHFQNFETGNHKDEGFTVKFPQYDICANKAFSQEALSIQDLFSDYALRNFQEFWAESVEIFFEKPVQLKNTYPDLYNAMCELMNQQPLANSASV